MTEILAGILRAPYPSDPSEMGAVEWTALREAILQAADEIDRLQAEASAGIRWYLQGSDMHKGKGKRGAYSIRRRDDRRGDAWLLSWPDGARFCGRLEEARTAAEEYDRTGAIVWR